MFHPRKMVFVVWEKDSAQIRYYGAIPAVLSSEPQTQIFPHTILVHSALLLLELRVSGCKLDFVHWPFKRVSVSLEDSCLSLVDIIPTDFQSQILCWHLFPALVIWSGEPGLVLRPFASKGGHPNAELSLRNLSHHP